MVLTVIALEIDEGTGCSNSLLSYCIKKHFLQISAHFEGWTRSRVIGESISCPG